MRYQSPSLDLIGTASNFIQGLPGVGHDGNPITQNSRASLVSTLEEE